MLSQSVVAASVVTAPVVVARPACPAVTGIPVPPARELLSISGLLDEAGPCTGARVLVLGPQPADTMTALIRQGCRAAMSLRPGAKPDAAAFDVVLVGRLTPGDALDAIVACAWRALKPHGRLVANLTDGSSSGPPGLELERRLRLHGFGAFRTRHLGRSLLLRAVLKGSAPAAHHA